MHKINIGKLNNSEKPIKELNKWKNVHVHGQEESVLSRCQLFPTNPIDSLQSQSKAGILFAGH